MEEWETSIAKVAHVLCGSVGKKAALLSLLLVAVVALRRALEAKQRRALFALQQICRPTEKQPVGDYDDAGITSDAHGWSFVTALVGTIVGLLGFVGIVVPIMLPIAITNTFAEALRHLFGLDTYQTEAEEGDDEQITLIMPGTCTYAFWQTGMVHYICENFDTRDCKLAGVSSGAICSAFILNLEKAAALGDKSTACERVRKRAHEVFTILENRVKPVTTWPCAFVARLGYVLDGLAEDILRKEFNNKEVALLDNRIRIGFRRLARGVVPALVPDSVNSFSDVNDFITSMSVSGHVGIVVRPTFLSYFLRKDAYCSDGVNPISFYCIFEHWIQKRWGISERTAPSYCQNGLDMIYALWNCGVMRVLLPRKGKHLWISPTVGGKLDVLFSLRVSDWWAAEQWRLGYKHAKELDAKGYWNDLPRWNNAPNHGDK